MVFASLSLFIIFQNLDVRQIGLFLSSCLWSILKLINLYNTQSYNSIDQSMNMLQNNFFNNLSNWCYVYTCLKNDVIS